MKHIRLPEFEEIVEESIDKHNARVYAVEGVPAVDVLAYLRNDKGDWSDVEEEKKQKEAAANAAAAAVVKQEQVEEGMIALSDSEDESDADDEPLKPTVAAAAAPVVVKVEAAVPPVVFSAAAAELERRKALYMAALNKPKSSRAMLLTTLRQKVHETARENYCSQKKIQVDQLAVRLEIFEKSR